MTLTSEMMINRAKFHDCTSSTFGGVEIRKTIKYLTACCISDKVLNAKKLFIETVFFDISQKSFQRLSKVNFEKKKKKSRIIVKYGVI